ncbi:chitin synthesis regulation, resistance to congo red-domain-containing protein [Xylogone sp. PMI_703]|nr:chitin synthesis regulation, resistance to congo red-domain-containing protein [Xylogone sp. PMI_703]
MAALVEGINALVRRQSRDCDFFDNDRYYCDSRWHRWGRWVALAVIIIAALIFAILFSWISARHRRRRNMQPYYGTGWLAKPPPYDNSQNYNPNTGYYGGGGGPAAPPYTHQPIPGQQTGNTFNSNEGYYGQHYGQQNGYEMQPPQNAYYQDQRGGAGVYQAPDGPPPKHAPK